MILVLAAAFLLTNWTVFLSLAALSWVLMRYSELSWRRKAVALILFFAIMGAVSWFAHKLAYEWLPTSVTGYLGLAIFTLAVGYLWGDRNARRSFVAKSRRPDVDLERFASEKWDRSESSRAE